MTGVSPIIAARARAGRVQEKAPPQRGPSRSSTTPVDKPGKFVTGTLTTPSALDGSRACVESAQSDESQGSKECGKEL